MKIIREEQEYIIKGLDSDVSLTKEQIVELANTSEIFKQNNVIMFDKYYEVLDIDDVNPLRFGFCHDEVRYLREYIIQGLDSDVSLTKKQIIELTNTLETFKQNNVNLFNENYEVLDIDDVNSLRRGLK